MRHHNIEIKETYKSKSGTGRMCKSIQGYNYEWWTGKSWGSSIKSCKQSIDHLRKSVEGNSIERISSHVLSWCKSKWPEYQSRIDEEFSRRQMELDEKFRKEETRKGKIRKLSELFPELKIQTMGIGCTGGSVVVDLDSLLKILGGSREGRNRCGREARRNIT